MPLGQCRKDGRIGELAPGGAGASAPGTLRVATSLASGSPPTTRKGWKMATKQRAGDAKCWQGGGMAGSHTRWWECHLRAAFGNLVGHGYYSHPPVTQHLPSWVDAQEMRKQRFSQRHRQASSQQHRSFQTELGTAPVPVTA